MIQPEAGLRALRGGWWGYKSAASTSTLIQLPATFMEYLGHAYIEGDQGATKGQAIPFRLFPFQRAIAERFASGESMVILKRRQAGLSWLAVHYCLYMAMFSYGHSAIISAGQREADEFVRKMVFAHRHLPELWRRPYKGVSPMKFEGGNIVQALPSKEDSGISFTFARLFVDEAAAHPHGEANYGQYRAAVANGQYLCFSAANPKLGPSGFFYDMWQGAVAGDLAFSPVFVPRDARPDQGPAWFEQERKAYTGQPETFEAIYPESPEQAFVGKSGLVYPEFSTQLHVRTDHPMSWEQYTYRFAGIDPGGGDPSAIVPIGCWVDHKTGKLMYHQPHEFYSRAPVTVDHIAGYLSLFHNKAPFDRIWIDHAGGATVMASLQALGFPVMPANKNRDGIIAVRAVLAENRLTHHVSCKEGIAEYAGYRVLERRDPNSHDKFPTRTPVDHHADGHDARRYVIVQAETLIRRGEARDGAAGPTRIKYT